ncbi:unnamed protein product [Rotaria sordida]|uniref:B box-type domain-containing protein n=1 Tax=Rotaria sordida TaxID=392033 RepID=A0A819UVV7_9BILA|nr:unnamed protein product [Rotaria sordida]CAF4101420.1 unnamed protein product [Rotaria sordida]
MCIACGDVSGRQVTCYGCQQSFCWTHLKDHQNYIEKQMDALAENYERLKADRQEDCCHHQQQQLFRQIDQWGKDSIVKIQQIADTARADLRSFIKQSEDHMKILMENLGEEIKKSRQLNNYSEIDINQWTEQLENIHSQIQTSFNIQIEDDEQASSITLIKIKQNAKRSLDSNKQRVKRSRNETNNDFSVATTINHHVNIDRFDKVLEKSKLYEENLVAINGIDSRSCISGANSYSNGRHSVTFSIENVYQTGWSCFFGTMTSNESMQDDVSKMVSVYGVWSSGYHVQCGKKSGSCGKRRWNICDDVTLTFDCDNKQLRIENKRINWCQVFDIDLHSCPFPWKFITIIKGCQLRIKNLLL